MNNELSTLSKQRQELDRLSTLNNYFVEKNNNAIFDLDAQSKINSVLDRLTIQYENLISPDRLEQKRNSIKELESKSKEANLILKDLIVKNKYFADLISLMPEEKKLHVFMNKANSNASGASYDRSKFLKFSRYLYCDFHNKISRAGYFTPYVDKLSEEEILKNKYISLIFSLFFGTLALKGERYVYSYSGFKKDFIDKYFEYYIEEAKKIIISNDFKITKSDEEFFEMLRANKHYFINAIYNDDSFDTKDNLIFKRGFKYENNENLSRKLTFSFYLSLSEDEKVMLFQNDFLAVAGRFLSLIKHHKIVKFDRKEIDEMDRVVEKSLNSCDENLEDFKEQHWLIKLFRG